MLGSDEIARREDGKVSYASEPRRATWLLPSISARDGHQVNGTWRFSASVPTNSADQTMLAEVLMAGRSSVRAVEVVEHLAPGLMSAATDTIGKLTAKDAVAVAGQSALMMALRKAAETSAFACGVEILGPFELDLVSASLSAEMARAADRSRTESELAERARHLTQARDLAAAITAGTSSPTALLAATASVDRPAALSAMLATGEDDDRRLHLVSGSSLFVISDAASADIQVVPLDGNIGALRSVDAIADSARFACGGQSGVYCAGAYYDNGPASPLGFNAVASLTSLNEIWATHSERGLVRWSRSCTAAPLSVRSIAGAGHLTTLDATSALFAVGSSVYLAKSDEHQVILSGTSDVVGIAVDGRRIYITFAGGEIHVVETSTWRTLAQQARGGAISAFGVLPWVGGVRLLVACRDGVIDCLGTDDTLVTRYSSSHVGFRAVCASRKWVAAMTGDRQRVVLWHTADGRQPAHEIHVARITGHRVAGMAFV